MTKAVCYSIAALCWVVALIGPQALGITTPAPLAPPTPSASPKSTFAIIGALERDRKTQPSALDTYVNDHDPAVATRAILALGRLNNPAANSTLTGILGDGHRSAGERAMAAFSLGLIGSADSASTLASATRRNPPEVEAAAAQSLGRVGGNLAIEVLVGALGNGDASVRAQAAVGLGEAGFSGAPFIDAVHRQSAATALSSAIFSERDSEVRWREAWALGRSYFSSSGSTLRRLLTDDMELVRMFAVAGLGRSGDRQYAIPLRVQANDPSWRVRVEVQHALGLLGQPARVDTKAPAVPDSDLHEPAAVPTSAPFGDHPQVAIVTGKGVIVIELFPDEAPYSVDNFLSLVDRKFYNKLAFFRVIPGFVVQGGDPKNTGQGGPGYSIPSERNPIAQLTGIISYGLDYVNNAPVLDSAGSQYYITQNPQLHLDRAFTVFGRVVKGMAVVDAITPQPDNRPPGLGPPDIAKKVYRCVPVTPQTDDVEQKLRTVEIGYDAR